MCGLDYLGNPNTHYVKRRCCHIVIPLDTYKHTNMEKSLDTRHNSTTWTEAETVGYQQNNREQSKQVCHGKMTFCLYLIEEKKKKTTEEFEI